MHTEPLRNSPLTRSPGRTLVTVSVLVVILVFAGLLTVQLTQIAAGSPGEFTVTDLEPGNATVDEGDVVGVSATIENTGNTATTQTVDVVIGDTHERPTVTLAPGESETVRVNGVPADSLDLGPNRYRVSTDDDELTATLVVESDRPASFEVSGLEPGDHVLDGDDRTLTVSATVENVGGNVGTQTVALRIDNRSRAETTVTLDPGESETVRVFNLHLDWLGSGEHTYEMRSNDDGATGTITVNERGTFALVDHSFEPDAESLRANEPFTVQVTVGNVGDLEANGTVDLSVGNDVLGSSSVTVAGGEERTVALDGLETHSVGVGLHRYRLSAGEASYIGTMIVEGAEPARYTAAELYPGNTTVDSDGSFNVSARITNEGERTADQSVELRLDGEEVDRRDIVLPPGESTAFESVRVSVDGLEPGEYRYTVVTEADEETATVRVVD